MPHDFAIVGLDALLPGSDSAEAWMATDTPAFRTVDPGRWPLHRVDSTKGTLDAALSDVGAFVEPARVEVPDVDCAGWPVDRMDPLFGWVLRVVGRSLDGVRFDGSKTGLWLANLGLPTTGAARAIAPVYGSAPWLEGGVPEDRWHSGLPAALAARAYGLADGVALDAACASGLYAVRLACDRLASGEVDAAVAAAVNRSDSSYLFFGFSQLRALSPTGTARPLDARADGLIVGEGAAAVVLKRLPDAIRDGDRIHAVLRGGGLGNDGRKGNMLAPDGAGQLRAMRAAWDRAGLDPRTLGTVECHATGTPVGDGVELRSLATLLDGASEPVAVHSAKAMVGHTVTAAGLAGLLRVIGAVRDGYRLPAVGVCEVHPAIAESPSLTVLSEREDWDGARRAAVSAFGFGGTNAHLIVDAFDPSVSPDVPPMAPETPRLAVVGLGIQVGDLRGSAVMDAEWRGSRVTEVAVDPRRYRIPPIELADLLPQQLLMLDVAADAMAQAGELDTARVASIVGMGVDHHIAESVVRWAELGDGRGSEIPALTASRVQGSLPNFVANRIAAQFDLQGPSWTVSSGPLSGLHALQQAGRLLAIGAADAVLVGAVDLPGHLGSALAAEAVLGAAEVTEGAVALVVMPLDTALSEGRTVLAELGPVVPASDAPPSPLGRAEAVDGLLQLLRGGRVEVRGWFGGLAVDVEGSWEASDAARDWDPVLVVPHEVGEVLEWPPVGEPTGIRLTGTVPSGGGSLQWAIEEPVFVPPPPPAAPLRLDLYGLESLAAELQKGAEIVARSHEQWLQTEIAHQQTLMGVGSTGLLISPASTRTLQTHQGSPSVAAEIPKAEPILDAPQTTQERSPERASPVDPTPIDLLAHAGGTLADAFGPEWADLDRYEPRVRMPMPPLLLASRVVEIEGERGVFGPSRIVTEYDIPPDADWTPTGRPPPCVMVESGQADLLLVSYLGIDAENRGERVYRLLDCDLTFHGPLPDPGETLRHDIRIDRFARLGATTLFYFHYDCISTTDGRPVLSMRNGCAGFFTPAELSTPKGLRDEVDAIPPQTPLPLPQTLPTSLDDPSHLPLLPQGDWRLVHRITSLHTTGGAHGLGEVVYEQVLRDDDWFNPCHFVGDPCMPGTLMFDGCTQAVQVWLLAHGLADEYPDASFEPLPGTTAQLRCRGQVVPGHSLLKYKARIKRAGLEPSPYAVADVMLEVDGTDVVLAKDVGVCIRGERRARTEVDARRVLEYSIGSAERGFGPAYAGWDGPDKRCARMPGPPYLTMTRVHDIEGPAGVIEAGRTVVIDYDVPEDAWYFRAEHAHTGGSMPFAVLLETALQPCGWLTAWQQMAIEGGRDLYFRNLGGEGVQLAEVPPGTTLRTTATLTSTSASGGMRIVFFESSVRAGGVEVFRCTTSFGYFSKAALSGQKGLLPPPKDEEQVTAWRASALLDSPIDLAGHPSQPRDDWRMLHRVTHADPTGGREGRGFYQAAHTVDPDTWFFHAHFHLDPVMPGSLGLEALLQLARFVFVERNGEPDGRFLPLTLDHPVTWLYRGQVLRPVTEMTVELEVLALTDSEIRCRGIVRADELPIYRFEDFGLSVVDHPVPVALPEPSTRPEPVAALLDRFTVDGDVGHGVLHLDPELHPWLADHCPTVTVPAVPMAFAAEIAAEAARQLRPGSKVVAIPELSADKWIHTGDGPIDLIVVAVAEGDSVAVTLSVHEDNPRFPKLSGPKVHMRAVVQLGADWAPAEPVPELDAPEVQVDIRDYYDGGHTFHGPTLQGMTALTRLGPLGAEATFRTRPDRELLGVDAAFELDPLLLDTATHPMWSAEPERWVDVEPGHLAYPIRAENLRFFGPRPEGDVRCVLQFVEGSPRHLTFDVFLEGWCAFRWTEAIVDAGPFLGQPPEVRRAFLWDRVAAEVRIGRTVADGWRVDLADLVEPLPGTLARIACSEAELADRPSGEDAPRWDAARLAAKEAIRSWLRDRLGRDVHPSTLTMLDLRPDQYVVVDAPELTAAEYAAHLGPTRFDIRVWTDESGATARVDSRG